MTNLPRLVVALAAALILLLAATPGASANGVPQLVKLTYLEGISNFGPRNAEGVLEFSFSEAYARVDVKNLPPTEGYTYEGWLTGGASTPYRVGIVSTRPDGIGLLETRLQDLTSYDYNLFVIAARPANDQTTTLPTTLSIAGRFQVIDNDGRSPAGDVRPGALPDTGQASGPTTTQRIARTAFTILALGGIAFVVLRLTLARRHTP
ncbi:hypothetical protein [Tepidiforma sp.]|uniref:hypothetical protein n=1 Tax=Tepidiforma sp. TaxID=2682230 RepID=UPI002ADD7AE8|nr:hypothetical protein [Tepidiforma sp.]